MKTKSGKIAGGIVMILLPIISGTIKNLGSWGSAELVGYNAFVLAMIFGGAYLIYKGYKTT